MPSSGTKIQRRTETKGAFEMSIQKKSLISALKTTKKANVASSSDDTSAGKKGTSLGTRHSSAGGLKGASAGGVKGASFGGVKGASMGGLKGASLGGVKGASFGGVKGASLGTKKG
jgi:hypothetical protein